MEISRSAELYRGTHRLEQAVVHIKSKDGISSGNKRLILSFLDFCRAEGLSTMRTLKYAYILPRIAQLLEVKRINLPKRHESAGINPAYTIKKRRWVISPHMCLFYLLAACSIPYGCAHA